MKLVNRWKESWTWFSQQAMASAVALQLGWTSLPADLKAGIPQEWVSWLAAVVLLLGIGGRLVDQSKPPEPEK